MTDDPKDPREHKSLATKKRPTAEDLRRRIAEQEAKAQPDSVEYQHSLLCALTLPRSRQKERQYIREGQGRILKLEAGDLYNGTKLLPQPLPYGPKARLALMHICSEAVKIQSRFIEVEGSARAFMERIGIQNAGNQYRLFRQQMNALAACRLILGYKNQNGMIETKKVDPIEDFKAWVSDDDDQPALWASELKLGEVFFLDLMRHAVPLSGNAIRGLSHSALALDYYCFFAYRLHVLEKNLFLPWHVIRDQIGQEYANVKDFKKESIPAIKAVLALYPSARVEIIEGGLLLKPSPPPIARRSVGVLPGLADKVKANLPRPRLESQPAPPARPAHQLHYKTIEWFKATYPRKDVYACEADFRYWLETSNAEQPRSYDAAFRGFAKKWNEPNG